VVSTVIPVFNGVGFLADAVASVYAQTVVPDEVIVVDDGSTDGTADVLRSLEKTCPSTLRWVTQPNRGEANARNVGIQLATGDFVAFLDHDDRWVPEKLGKQLGHLAARPDLSMSFTGYKISFMTPVSPGEGPTPSLPFKQWNPDPAAVLEKLMRSCAIRPPSSVLIRRDALARVPGFDESLRSFGSDWLMWLNIAAAGMKIGYLADPLVDYRWHGRNISRGRRAFYDAACEVFDRFFATRRDAIPVEGRARRGRWWRSRWHMLAAIDASECGDKVSARNHILRAARINPFSVRPGWIRMLGVGIPSS
jgi:glycosyltransferase involved in cell wall biosynthesis